MSITERPRPIVYSSEGDRIEPEEALQSAIAVSEKSTPHLKKLDEWRRQSLAFGGRRVVG